MSHLVYPLACNNTGFFTPHPTVQHYPDAAHVARVVQKDADDVHPAGDRHQRQRNRPVQRANRAMSRA